MFYKCNFELVCYFFFFFVVQNKLWLDDNPSSTDNWIKNCTSDHPAIKSNTYTLHCNSYTCKENKEFYKQVGIITIKTSLTKGDHNHAGLLYCGYTSGDVFYCNLFFYFFFINALQHKC